MKNENENEFASASFTAGQLNAIVKKLGGKEGAMAFLRGETAVATKNNVFKNDKAKDGWKLLEDVPFDGKEFTP